MPVYLMLTTLTDEGRKTIRDNPDRIKEVDKEVELMGVKILTQYALLGQYDFVNIIEAPRDEVAAKLAINLSARGTVQTLTFSAMPVDELIATLFDLERIPFAYGCFDLVTSVAAFEHFLDVPATVDEVDRVLKPGGYLWILIHPFSSLSGGHNVKRMEIPLRALPKGVAAWDHLRERCVPFHVPLNEWRIHRYVEEFSRRFEILEATCIVREGEHLLTSTVLSDLPSFTREELTCRTYQIVGRKGA